MSLQKELKHPKKKVLCVFGTRPEAIKMAPLVLALQGNSEIECRVCVTAQHREMLDQVMRLFGLEADYDLNLMQPGQNLTDLTARALQAVRDVLVAYQPDLVLVHGDTTTTLAAGLAAFYQHIPVGHVEAGLRTGNLYAPWPEELNRSVVGLFAALHFALTATAANNLLQAGVAPASVFITGNTVLDALLQVSQQIDRDAGLAASLAAGFPFLDPSKKLILVTGHRRENFGDGFVHICQALRQLALRDDVQIVYPVHLNPQVQAPVNEILQSCSNVHLIDPQTYLPFVYLLKHSFLVLTDSGGIQEEAPTLGKPVLVMRETTERPEAVDAGTAKLVGTNGEHIVQAVSQLLDEPEVYQAMAQAGNPYGDGNAAERIVDLICAWEGGR
ncbi:UDP-N-acetylglucosamine 2-epimerase (non-hydrolyzing) [Deefgea piscis]|uniref:UDP-N-acetylglucosamine 2-epimerase (non-hydrolyzing) n=1 Tax=Deefgea piscis TaxID=2739061 RepID=A0A6M8SXN0_9NEIS|nr:UDP-N-acetylglucosamine 2-epimerase (non-hydrolyzing) [Deefgea piscis]QKJ67339.1 UDP-N-acetylglucosamine 2-epimerase (non-hydrolyzing) [Deefgea piscis]